MAERGSGSFTKEEKAAMKERAAEARREKSAKAAEADRQACLDKIAELDGEDRVLAERVHAIVTAAAPELAPKTFYGMPAYARAGKVVCFFQPGSKFKGRYSTLGFQDAAALDDGLMWATSFALLDVDDQVEARITELVERAASG